MNNEQPLATERTPERSRGRQIFSIQLFWVILGALATFLGWRLINYVRRLLGQPAFEARMARIEEASELSLERTAFQIAKADLLSGAEVRRLASGEVKWVLCAGARNFREPWARDFGFASFGLLALGEYQIVRETLETFLFYQRPSGRFPVKVHSTSTVDRYLHQLFRREQPIGAPLRPRYTTAHRTRSYDGNALLTVAALNYICETDDLAFGEEHWPALQQAVAWLEQRAEGDRLVPQRPFADWADSIARSGKVLYTNVLYWKAVERLSAAAQRLGQQEEATQYAAQAEQIGAAIQAHFWREDLGYYVTSSQFTNLNSDGNLLAVAWGLADEGQARRILDTLATFEMAEPVPTQVASFAYPRRYIAIENYLAGIPHYHTDAAWLWLGGWHIVAALRTGREAEAHALAIRLSKVLVRDGVVHEAYDQEGNHLSTRWYTSESPLTWNAGMVVYALHELYNQNGENVLAIGDGELLESD